ncbi:hypothetical protein TRVA0_052S00914 [Trichomonascus vanleenenianus]|uniref:uncharacterized protein n=1 Tax=Trichomonascus vanleenenianus TaxID=2268995 RepID=UPI003EC9B187
MSDAELLEQIAKLAGAINRHKNNSNGSLNSSVSNSRSNSAPPYRSRPAPYYSQRGGRWGNNQQGRFSGAQWTNPKTAKANTNAKVTKNTTRPTPSTVEINGVVYKTSKHGSKLVREGIPEGDSTPKKAVVNGVPYVRTKSGNLMRPKHIDKACPYYTKTGTCGRGLSCPYKHDNNHISICKHWLMGKCNRPDCTLSHKPTAHNSPLCQFYLKGNCTSDNCKYTHMDVPAGAPVCREFAIDGYCEEGDKCKKRHVFECPDFASTGSCSRHGCKLKHILRNSEHHVKHTEEESKAKNIDLDMLASGLYAKEEQDEDEEVEEVGEEENESEEDSDEESSPESEVDSGDDDDFSKDFIKI